jgi:hypothetical protein
MEYDGLVVRYPVNRPLTDEDRETRVEVGVPTSFSPSALGAVIVKTDCFIELVDKYYAWKGVATGLFLGPLLAFSWVAIGFPSAIAAGLARTPESEKWLGWLAGGFGVAVGLGIAAMLLWLVLRESFTLTHFPIRFQRKSRMVYVFRPRRRADVLRVKWDDVFWHIRRNKNKQFGSYNWFVAGHVMAKDKKTVLETFAFGHVGSSPEEVYPQWEYVRRFMEQGADAVPEPDFCLPIKDRKEGFWWGAQTLLFNTPINIVASMALLPFTALGVVARWLCMLTNRVPVWPADIDAQCVGSGDRQPLPEKAATPEHSKIVVFLAVGLLIDVALISWIFGLPPVFR